MPNLAYRRGADWERDYMEMLEVRGWATIRSAGSHRPIDVFAGKSDGGSIRTIGTQCKTGKGRMTRKDIRRLQGMCAQLGAVPVLAVRAGRTRRFYTVTPFGGLVQIFERWFD